MLQNVNSELKSQAQRFEKMDFQNLLSRTFSSDVLTCSWQLLATGATINTAGMTSSPSAPSPTVISIPVLYGGQDNASPVLAAVGQPLANSTTGMTVNRIEVAQIHGNPAATRYFATLFVYFSNTVRTTTPVRQDFVIDVAPASPPGARTIVGCGLAAAPSTAPPGTICGLSTNGCGWPGSISCEGMDPGCGACPAGYTVQTWLVSFGSGTMTFCGKN